MNNNGVCFIIGAGEPTIAPLKINKNDYMIAVDGGFSVLEQAGIEADIVVGDFDSYGKTPTHHLILKAPAEKDDTDMMMAIKHGLEKGYRVFHIFGGTGGRFDHSVANLQLLTYLARRNAQGFLYAQSNIITAITNTTMHFDSTYKGYISVLAADSKVEGVTLTGLKYPLTNATITNEFPIGVSNEFLGVESSVCIANGSAFIIIEKD
ncbi:thiamine diphosphokinase [Paludicola sp. MB14-C6]|uniref:thiamine diphosphokinase n=1 Tax=Paludihabitans sp. MB14-C6 TaxID=3070656 RepID=UPI0027DAF794|nr:thiamine diphosphokinase [Paludicola sp. MB14-C6]WMJ21929.1 thiamine diphosphokinase [Paludicola sp. MB14-C6]